MASSPGHVLVEKNKIKLLDWGGISSIETPNGIDNFKMGFGGTVEKNT